MQKRFQRVPFIKSIFIINYFFLLSKQGVAELPIVSVLVSLLIWKRIFEYYSRSKEVIVRQEWEPFIHGELYSQEPYTLGRER